VQNDTVVSQEKVKKLTRKMNLAGGGFVIGSILAVVGVLLGRTPGSYWQSIGLGDPLLGIVTNIGFIGFCILLGLVLLFGMLILVVYYGYKRKKLTGAL
jgi:hypothetical protein